MELSIANVHDVIFNPGVVNDEGVIEATIGVDVLTDDAKGTASVAVQTLKHTPDGDYEFAVVERTIARTNISVGKSVAVAWLLGGETTQAFPIVEFDMTLYETTAKSISHGRLGDLTTAFDRWSQVMPQLLRQHTTPSWRTLDRSTISWTIEKADVDDDCMRAIFTLHKMQSWIDHDGKLATPWGSINCAEQPPVIVEGSVLDRIISQQQRDGRAVTISNDTWFKGLKMPSFDHDRVRRILAAQRVLIEVPLAA